ncbi:MAG: hypothetical protein Q9225_001765 [Loekoesia sp. 1 TL-2023]
MADESEDKESPLLGHEVVGIPCRIQRLSWLDIAAVAIVLIAAAVAVASVWEPTIAMFFGQTNQLVVLGLALAIMAFCTQRQVRKLTLLYEARFGASTLQNFDAVLRNDYFASAITWQPRLVIWLLLLLPLGLSAAYKTFSGGSTDLVIYGPNADFGATAAPGYQLIGDGLSLLSMVYLPFWMNPAVNRTYGFNLYVANDTTAAILDAPLPVYLTSLQTSLQNDQSMTITAKVDATVTQNIDPSESERNDMDYWQSIKSSYSDKKGSVILSLNDAIWAGQKRGDNFDWSVTYLSRWDTSQSQTFESQAERFVTTRQTCTGTWNITRTNVSLIQVNNLEAGVEDGVKQDVISNNRLRIEEMFFQFLGEYDWTGRKTWKQRLPGSKPANPQYIPTMNTRPALVAAMLWSRLVSLDGPERWTDDDPAHRKYTELKYPIQSSDIGLVKRGRTLRRSSWLVVTLVIHPILTIAAVLGKALMFDTPVSDDFGLISLLAGVKESGVEKLRGAALSGKLKREMRVRFRDWGADVKDGYRRLELELGEEQKTDLLMEGKYYG